MVFPDFLTGVSNHNLAFIPLTTSQDQFSSVYRGPFLRCFLVRIVTAFRHLFWCLIKALQTDYSRMLFADRPGTS